MGHAKVDTTLNVYTQVVDAHFLEPPTRRIRIVHYCQKLEEAAELCGRAGLVTLACQDKTSAGAQSTGG